MSKDSWGRWGESDERGALNLIGAPQVRKAAALIDTGEIFPLAQPLSRLTLVPEHRNPLMHLMNRDGADYAAGAKRPGGFQFAEDTIVSPLHIGTHLDALCHAWYDDQLYNGHPSADIRSTTGAARCGIDKLGPIVSRGVLFDIVRLRDRPLEKGEAVTAADLMAAADGWTIQAGDVALIRTGWQENDGHTASSFYAGEPGLDVNAGLWLAEQDVAVVGADNFAIEVLPNPEGKVFPVHQRLIRDFGVSLLEGMVLGRLAAAVAKSSHGPFFFAAAPLPIVGGTGSPLTPFAIL